MKQITSQIRLQKWQVDEAQRHIAELIRLSERLGKDLLALDKELLREEETAASSLEAGRTYAAYRIGAQERRKKLLISIAEIDEQVVQGRDNLATSFGELKKFELVSAAAIQRMREQQDRREQQRADELGLSIYRRRAAR